MPFTAEQEETLLAMITAGNITPAATATPAAVVPPVELASPTPLAEAKPAEAPRTIAQEAKDSIDTAKAAEIALVQIQSSVKFNHSVGEFVEKNKSLLPEEAATILTTAATKTFKNENEKANVIRKSLLDSFLSVQENLDALKGSLKDRAIKYRSLVESEKENQSVDFWDLAELGTALKAGNNKADALNKINGVGAGDGEGGILENKILAAAALKFNKSK